MESAKRIQATHDAKLMAEYKPEVPSPRKCLAHCALTIGALPRFAAGQSGSRWCRPHPVREGFRAKLSAKRIEGMEFFGRQAAADDLALVLRPWPSALGPLLHFRISNSIASLRQNRGPDLGVQSRHLVDRV